VAVRVVEAFEVVDVEQGHVQRRSAAAGADHLADQVQVPGTAVGDPGQGVVVRPRRQLGRLVLDLRHQLRHAGDDQQEQHHRAEPKRDPVDRQATDALEQEQCWREQGSRCQDEQTRPGDAHAASRGHLRQ
jgi:hypothetical protein